MNAIETRGLTKTFGPTAALRSLDLQVKQGELVALLGVNGAGKTTLMKLLSCLTAPSAGEAWILGHSILKEPEAVKAAIALAPQETAVAPRLTVQENLELMAGAYGFSRQETHRARDRMMAQFSLEPLAKTQAYKLSGGWQRTLSLAMALISEPRVLFLDEPTLGLDVLARHKLWDNIRTIGRDTTIVLTTHQLEEAAAMAQRVLVLSKGALRAQGTVQQLVEQTGAPDFETAFVQLVKEASP